MGVAVSEVCDVNEEKLLQDKIQTFRHINLICTLLFRNSVKAPKEQNATSLTE
jgi:hypothetical protein